MNETWWLAFATDTQFLGVVVVDAPTFVDAVKATHHAGVNPGGKVLGVRLSGVPAAAREEAMALPRLRLFTKDQIQSLRIEIEQLKG